VRSAFFKLFLVAMLLSPSSFTLADEQTLSLDPAAKLLVDRVAEVKATGAARAFKPETITGFNNDFRITSGASRSYQAKDGERFVLTVVTADADAAAYALLTTSRRLYERSHGTPQSEIGTAGFATPERLFFVKGRVLVVVDREDGISGDSQPLTDFAKAFAETLDNGEGEIPVLVKHLPGWQNIHDRALYAVSQNALKSVFANQSVLDVVSFAGGAEAVIADYQGTQLVIIEFNTPQIAGDTDRRINARIQELRNQGQVVPTAYRRVGNYAVFVFDAPSAEAANQLIDQVKYQQMVQWLGRNPYLYDEAANEFTQTTLGVFIAVVKASGLVILGSLALGGLFGALLFSRRRAQQRAVEAYSDAGGMLRLNLDELSPPTDPARLLGPGR
jgi:hypothetical protein